MSMQPAFFDNRTAILKDDLVREMRAGSKGQREFYIPCLSRERGVGNGGASITDLSLNDFRMGLVTCHEANPDIERVLAGINAVVSGEDPGITLTGANLATVWEALCAQVRFDDVSVDDVDARIAQEKRITELETQVAQLERKDAKEVQPSKRNAVYKTYRQTKADLSALKGE